MESSDKEDYEAKEKAFYSAMISAWLNTRLERDKQLLGLSVTAIGLLVTLLRTVGVSSFSQVILYGFALFAFLITLVSVIYILGENSTHIEKMLESSETESRALIYLDKAAGFSFVTGMILIVIIGMHSAVINLSEKGTSMSQEKPSDTHRQSVTNNDSWNGVAKLRPQPPKAPQTNPNTEPSATNPSATSGGNGSSSAGESSSSS
jgi:Na+-transporting methylmalonyl-CoA/oxaloacetate decarboxylase gamma subunit